MARLVVVAVKDSALGAYGRPVFVPTFAAALRSFIDEVNRVEAGNQMRAHPDDFELHEIGTFEEETGKFGPSESATVIRAKDVIQEIKP